MDTESDFLLDMEKLDGINEENFFKWLKFAGLAEAPSWFLDNVWVMQDRRIIDLLKEKYWNEFTEVSHEKRIHI